MSDFKAKMHPNRFRLGLRPDSAGGAYSAPQTPYLNLRGPPSKGRGYRKGGEGGEGREGKKGREGREGWGVGIPVCIFKFSLE